jgi:hypothetical protein
MFGQFLLSACWYATKFCACWPDNDYTKAVRLCAHPLWRDHNRLVNAMESYKNSILLGSIYTNRGSASSFYRFVPSELIRQTSEFRYTAVHILTDVPTEICRKTWPALTCEQPKNLVLFFILMNETKGLILIVVISAEGKELFPNDALVCIWLICCFPATLMVRTWALWNQNKSVGCGLAILWLSFVIACCRNTIEFVRSFVSKWFICTVFHSTVWWFSQ